MDIETRYNNHKSDSTLKVKKLIAKLVQFS